jgi:hypothetical protein
MKFARKGILNARVISRIRRLREIILNFIFCQDSYTRRMHVNVGTGTTGASSIYTGTGTYRAGVPLLEWQEIKPLENFVLRTR